MSKFEQLLLYYNAVAWFSNKDNKEEGEWYRYFVDYKLIKNLPIALADFDINPEIYFKSELENGNIMFNDLEWKYKK